MAGSSNSFALHGAFQAGRPRAARPAVDPRRLALELHDRLHRGHAPVTSGEPRHRIHLGDNLDVLRAIPDASIDLVYADPPFNTGKRQQRTRLRTVRSAEGDRTGFQGRRYATLRGETRSFGDRFDDYLGFLDRSSSFVRTPGRQ